MRVLTASGKAALDKVASRDATRPVLTGVHLALDEEQPDKDVLTGWLAATDSYKLALVPVEFYQAEKPVEGVWPALAFKQAMQAPAGMPALVFSKDVVKVNGKNGEAVEHRRIDGQFPNYGMLFPDAGALVTVYRIAFNAKLLYELAQGLGGDGVIIEPVAAVDGTPNPLRPIVVRPLTGPAGARSVDTGGPCGILMPIRVAA